jgi:hypothetical protein
MKTSNRYRVKTEKIHSLNDLLMEKMRLRMEIMKTEENIHTGYREILNALTFRNIASTLIQEVSATSSVVEKAFDIGKSFFAKRKKKKHHATPEGDVAEHL